MANLNSSTQYNTTGTQSPLRGLANVSKLLQQNTQKTSSNLLKGSLDSHFNPDDYDRMFGSSKSTPVAANAPELGFPVNTPIAPQDVGVKTQPLPEGYNQYVPADQNANWVNPSDQAVARNWPTDMGGGQYITDPTQPGALVKSSRAIMDSTISPGAKKKILGDLPSSAFQVDHIIPLWVGGADTLQNLEILGNVTHNQKTAVQAVPLTLLANGFFKGTKAEQLAQAKVMALTWKDKDSAGLPAPDKSGYVPLDVAQKYAQKWENDVKNPSMWKYFGESLKEEMGKFGKGWLPEPIREIPKGFLGSASAGIIPGTEQTDPGLASTVGHTIGSVLGFGFGLGKFKAGVGALKGFGTKILTKKVVNKGMTLADDAIKEVIDVGGGNLKKIARANTLKSALPEALWFGAFGQAGIVGRELTGQEEFELKNHMKTFMYDAAFGGMIGSSGQNIKGYAKIASGTLALSLMSQGKEANIEDALKEAAFMTGLHLLGLKNRKAINAKFPSVEEIGVIENRKAATAKLSRYVGPELVPFYNKGDVVPETFTYNIPTLQKSLASENPTNPIFSNLKIENQADAAEYIYRKSFDNFSKMVEDAKIKGTEIPKDVYNAEVKSLKVAGRELYKQTLPPAEREVEDIKDIQSIAETLKIQVEGKNAKKDMSSWFSKDSSSELQQITTDIEKINTNKPHKDTSSAPKGSIPIVGANSSLEERENFSVLENLPEGTPMMVIKAKNVSPYLRLKETENVVKTGKSIIDNPEAGARTYFLDEKTKTWIPIGMAPTKTTIAKYNENHSKVENRMKEIGKEESFEKFSQRIKDDPSLPRNPNGTPISENRIKELFKVKDKFLNLSAEELTGKNFLNSEFPITKFNQSLDNESLTKFFNTKGADVIFGEKEKATVSTTAKTTTKLGKSTGETFVSMKLNDNSWNKTFNLRDLRRGKIPTATPSTLPQIKSTPPLKTTPTVPVIAPKSSIEATPTPETTNITSALQNPPKIEPSTIPYKRFKIGDKVQYNLSDNANSYQEAERLKGQIGEGTIIKDLNNDGNFFTIEKDGKVVGTFEDYALLPSEKVRTQRQINFSEPIVKNAFIKSEMEKNFSGSKRETPQTSNITSALQNPPKITPSIEKSQKITPKNFIEDLVKRSKISQSDAEPYIVKEKRYKELEKIMGERFMSYPEKEEMSQISKDLHNFLQEKGLEKKPIIAKSSYYQDPKIIEEKKNSLLKDALNKATSDMDLLKSKTATNDPDKLTKALKSTASGARSMIINNKINLPDVVQKNLLKTFNDNIETTIQNYVDNVFGGTKDLNDNNYSSEFHQYIGLDPEHYQTNSTTGKQTAKEIRIKTKGLDITQLGIKELKDAGYSQEGIDKIIKDNELHKYHDEFSDEHLAGKYNLELKDSGYLKLDKNGNPSFSNEFKKSNPATGGRNPLDVYGDFLKQDLKANKESRTISSENYIKDLNIMAKAPNAYAKWGDVIQHGLKKIIVDPQEPWLRELMKENPGKSFSFANLIDPKSSYSKRLYSTIQEQGHTRSQPRERIIAQVEGKSIAEIRRIDEETKAKEDEAMLARAERGINDEGGIGEQILKEEDVGNYNSKNEEIPKTGEDLSPTESDINAEDIKGMTVAEDFQKEKVQDLTNMELKFPSLLYEEITGKIPPEKAIVNDGITALKDILISLNSKLGRGKKITVFDNEAFQWKINKKTGKSEKINLFGGWNEIRDKFLKGLDSKKPDGQGGPYDGQGGVIGDIFQNIGNTVNNAGKTIGEFGNGVTNFGKNIIKGASGEVEKFGNLNQSLGYPLRSPIITPGLYPALPGLRPTSTPIDKITPLKEKMFNDYPFTPEGQKMINTVKVGNKNLNSALETNQKQGYTTEGNYIKGGNWPLITAPIEYFAKGVDKITGGDAYGTIGQKFDPERINIDPKSHKPEETYVHEALHSLFSKSTLYSDKNKQQIWNEQWTKLKNSNINLNIIDKHLLDSGYNLKNQYSLSTERFAYLGALVLEQGISVIPPELRPFYSEFINTSQPPKYDKELDPSTWIQRRQNMKPYIKKDGQGGPHDGKGGFISDSLSNIGNFAKSINPFGSSTTYYKNSSTPIIDPDTTKFLKAIAGNETSVVPGNKYASSQYSGLKSLGQAGGKYRVTEGELKSYSPRYLGKPTTYQEFMNSPQLQDTYMTNKYQYLKKLGYTPQQIADIHNKGMKNSSSPGSTVYQNPDYVQKFNVIYNTPDGVAFNTSKP